ncbi:MAG: AAA family ATPase [Candidatus Pacebacteria bacterium]|nr:AAA family ATPase [Candidatus Paceibacterota bacterium]
MNEEIIKTRKEIVIEEAVRYISLGFSVMPLGAISKGANGKKIIGYPPEWKKYQEQIVTKEEISKWDCENLGIVTGSVSDIVVLDTDTYKETFDKKLLQLFNLPITPMQQTASGGNQYLFRLPKGMTIKNAVCIGTKDSGIDIRGDGGMIISPPSRTDYGEYYWIISPFDEPIADIPPKLLELLTKSSEVEYKPNKTLPELAGLKEGEGRNSAMTSFIGTLLLTRPFDKWDSEILPMAQAVNNTYSPPLDNDEFFNIYKSITKTESERRLKLNTKTNTKENETEQVEYSPSLTHLELMTKEFPLTRFTIEPFFEQGTVNMISAPPNSWKSWFIFLFAVAVASGKILLDKFKTEKTNVMIVNEEDSPRLIQDRLKLIDAIDTSLQIYYRIAQGSKLTKEFIESLIKEAKEKDIGLIMFDSLRAVHEADENSSTEMQGVMDLLKKIARENITVIFTHHNRKKGMFSKGDDAESSRGSSAINASISGHISLEEVIKDDMRYLIVKHLKSKVGEKEDPFDVEVKKGNESINFYYLGEHVQKAEAMSKTKNNILDILQARKEWLSRNDLVLLKAGSLTSITAVIKELKKEGLIDIKKRKEVKDLGLEFLNDGNPVELLYSLKEDGDDITAEFSLDTPIELWDDT